MRQLFGKWQGSRSQPIAASILFVVAIVCSGCDKNTSNSDLKFIGVPEAQLEVQGRNDLLKLGGKSQGAWVDPRTEAEFKAGHIPGAINLPYERLALDKKKLEGYGALVVYGVDYNDAKAEAFSKRLIEYGFSNVRTLQGGLRAWKAEGHELEVSP